MRKLLSLLFLLPAIAWGQTYPSPTFNEVDLVPNATPLNPATAGLWSQVDGNGEYSTFVGIKSGFGANSANNAKGMFTAIGHLSCGGEGSGLVGPGPGLNAEDTCIGWAAGSHLTTAYYNTIVGVGNMRAETTGSNNTSVGVDSMAAEINGNNNVAFGVGALRFGAAPLRNVAIGTSVLQGTNANTGTPGYNIAIGYGVLSGTGVTSPVYNVIIGDQAGFNITGTSNDNTMVGASSGIALTTGQYNTFYGWNTGANVTTGQGDVILGFQLNAPAVGTNNYLEIGSSLSSVPIAGNMAAWTTVNLSSCGTGPAIAAVGTSDIRGTITTGTGATACTATFTTAKTNAPTCIVTARSGIAPAYTTSTTALTLSTVAASATYDYFCTGS